MTIGDYTVTINDKGSATATVAGDVVALCTAAGSNLSYEPGTEYACELGDGVSRTFYVLGEDGNNVKLIMNSNFESTVAWSRDENSVPDTANAYLASQTSGWTKLTQSQITLPESGRYWTSTTKSNDRWSAWSVTYAGSITARDITKYDGIRPVITIPKTSMSL